VLLFEFILSFASAQSLLVAADPHEPLLIMKAVVTKSENNFISTELRRALTS
jgi:hypothetical protein